MGPPGWWEAKFDMKTSCREHLLHSAVTESLSVGLPRGCHVLPFKGMARLHMGTCHELRFRQTYGWPACRNWIPSRNQAASSHGSSTSPHDAPTDVVISDLGQLNKWIFFRSGETAKLGPGLTTPAEAWHAHATPSGPSVHAATCCGLSLHIQNISETRLFTKAGSSQLELTA